MKKKNLWVLLAALIAVWGTAVTVYWDTLVMYVAPQIPLTAAFQQVIDDLDARYQEGPLPIFLQGYDEGGLQTVQLELEDASGAKGALDVQVDLIQNQIFAEGTLPDETGLGELSLYLDRDYAALTSDKLLAGGFYGITYDTFGQDMQNVVGTLETYASYAAWILPRAQIQKLEEGMDTVRSSVREMTELVNSLQGKMSWEIDLPTVPKIDVEALKAAPTALWALRGKVCTKEMEIDGQKLPCYEVVYRVEGETAETLWGLISTEPFPENGMVQLNCVLYQKSLIQIELRAAAFDRQISGKLTLGENAKTDNLALEINAPEVGIISASLRQEGEWRALRLDETAISYQWDPQTGNLALQLPGRKAAAMKLSETEKGFRIESTQLDRLLKLNFLSDYTCTAAVSRGASIQPPEFKKLDQWSIPDFLVLLNGLWGVIKNKL